MSTATKLRDMVETMLLPYVRSDRIRDEIVTSITRSISRTTAALLMDQWEDKPDPWLSENNESVCFHCGLLHGLSENEEIPSQFRDHLKQASVELKMLHRMAKGN